MSRTGSLSRLIHGAALVLLSVAPLCAHAQTAQKVDGVDLIAAQKAGGAAAAAVRALLQVHAVAAGEGRRLSCPGSTLRWSHGVAGRGCAPMDRWPDLKTPGGERPAPGSRPPWSQQPGLRYVSGSTAAPSWLLPCFGTS